MVDQVILVRNEEARERLRKKIGDLGLVMTIAESKGLEFSDVLLYDFCSDSSVRCVAPHLLSSHPRLTCSIILNRPADWRVLLSLFKSKGEGAPTFDPTRHAAVGQELRHLCKSVHGF